MRECMLTTFDNPFDYFEQFDLWLQFDKDKGYDCCERLARIVKLSEDMTQKEEFEAIEAAIDEIIANDFLNIFKKVWRPAELQELS